MEKLEQVLREAGELFKEGYYGSFETSYKGKADLVTEYDVKIEEFLIPKLKALYPEFEIIGEETYKEHHFPESGVFVDPIDGTTNFVHGLPFTAISIGVWKEGVALEGGVYNPILNEMFLAKKGEGAYKNGARLEVSKRATLQESLLATGFPYTKNTSPIDLGFVFNSLTNLLPKVRDIRRCGSASIDICYVASGTYDGFYEVNLKPWDVAAGVVILEEAGGQCTDYEGVPFKINDRTFVCSNAKIHDDLVQEVTF